MFKKTLWAVLASASLVAFADNASAPVATQPAATTTAPKTLDKDNTFDSNHVNSPNVNSRAYSGAQFPEQNQVTGQKKVRPETNPKHRKNGNMPKGKTVSKQSTYNSNQTNSPNVSSRAYSGAQFQTQNQVTGNKGQKYNTSQTKGTKLNNPNVNPRAYSGAQFPQQNSFNNDGQSVKKPAASAAQ